VPSRVHHFEAVAFIENFSLRDLAQAVPGGRLRPHELRYPISTGGEAFVYPFGAVVFHDVAAEQRDGLLEKIRATLPGPVRKTVAETFTVREERGVRTNVAEGALQISELGPARAAAVGIVVAQSASMEYYERLVEVLITRTSVLAEMLEKTGTVRARPASLHRFIGEAIASRNEVLSVLHLLDKPDEVWEDPELDRIYDDLRSEFDLADRYQSLEIKLRGVQDSLELLLEVARDRRMWFLEMSIALLILVELLISFWKR
jgi:uncharacterized Rmd1/YagE family protein